MEEQFFEQLRAAFQAAPNAVLIVDAAGRIRLTNQRLDRLFGYADGELVGQSVEVLVPEEARGHHPELVAAFFRLPGTRDMGSNRNLDGVTRDGRRIPLEIGLNPMHTQWGVFVLAAIVDATARERHAEKLRMAIDAAATAMVMVDRDARIVLTNAQSCETFGYSASELIGQPIETLVPERFRRRHAVYRTSFVRDPRRRRMGGGTDLYGRRKDGSEVPVEIGLTPIDALDGHFVMATIQDVTEIRQQTATISARNVELARLNEELTQFAYSASHELKAPLTSIAGLLACAADDLASGTLDELASIVGRARALASQLAERVENVLALARSERRDEKAVEVSIADLVAELEPRVAGRLLASDVRLSFDLSHDEPVVCEPTRLRQILENLVENAVKYSDPAKPERWVHVSTASSSRGLHLRVADNGIGIPTDRPYDAFRMFKRFGNHREPGTGLGLALVQKHVDRLGGEIHMTSSAEGSCFDVVVPQRSP